MNIQSKSSEDIFLWSDGTQCYREEYELGYYQQMSDDFEVIPVNTERYAAVNGQT